MKDLEEEIINTISPHNFIIKHNVIGFTTISLLEQNI